MYEPFCHYINIEGKRVKTCGIMVFNDKHNLIRTVCDVSTDYNAVKELTKRLNDGNVDIIHLDDILFDFYCDDC